MTNRERRRCEGLGGYLAARRVDQGLTIREAAAIFGVSHNAVHQWEQGKCSPSLVLLVDFVRVYGVSLEDLFAAMGRAR